MNRKLLIENLAKEVKTMVVESALNEELQKDAYDAVMEYRLTTNNLTAMTTDADLDRAEFAANYKRWKETTILLQSMREIVESPYFKAIVKMGKRVVPYILEYLKKEPDDMLVFSFELILGYSVLPKDRKIIPVDEQSMYWLEYFDNKRTAVN